MNFKKIILAVALVLTATLHGCDMFEDDTTSIPQGLEGADCNNNSDCISNSCVYPGVCQ